MFFEPEWRGKLSEMLEFIAAIDSVKFSSKSELSSRFFGRLKFFGRDFSQVFWRFRTFSEAFGRVWTRSDTFGCVRRKSTDLRKGVSEAKNAREADFHVKTPPALQKT